MTQVSYTLDYSPEYDAPEGHFASGDEAQDAETIAWIRRELDRGNGWAWCVAEVFASIEVDGEEYTGFACLGGCSYESRKAFVRGGYYADMCDEALRELVSKLQDAQSRGALTAEAHRELKTAGVVL